MLPTKCPEVISVLSTVQSTIVLAVAMIVQLQGPALVLHCSCRITLIVSLASGMPRTLRDVGLEIFQSSCL